MVDAINSINAGTNSVAQERSHYYIDWKKLTASEVLEYASQGEEVPDEILHWAEDYAKLTNVPDDVTYEAVNGSTDTDDARSVEEDDGGENSETIEEEKEEDKNKELSNMDIYEKAGILIGESNTAKNIVQVASADGTIRIANEKFIDNSATQEVSSAETELRGPRSRYDEINRKIKTNKESITPEDLKKLDKISNQLTNAGTKKQATLTSYDEQLSQIEIIFSQYDELPPPDNVKGGETKAAGAELLKKAIGPNGTLNIFYWLRGIQAMGSGEQLIGEAYIGENIFLAGHEQNKPAVDNVVESMEKIEELTFIKGNRADVEESKNDNETEENEEVTEEEAPEEETSTNDNNPENRTESENKASSTNKTDDKGIKDSTILVDDIEIKRRKENRGEIPTES